MDQGEILQEFGNKIRSLRKAKCFSQEDLGFESSLHRTYIGMIERGEKNITLINIYKLAKALDVKPKDIFDGIPS